MKKILNLSLMLTTIFNIVLYPISCSFGVKIKATEDPKIIISLEEIVSQTAGIKDFEDIQAVNLYLQNISITGVKSLTAKINNINTRNVDVNVEVEKEYEVENNKTVFIIYGALVGQPQFMVDIKYVQEQVGLIEKQASIEDYNLALNEIKIQGVSILSAKTKTDFSLDVIVSITLDAAYWLNNVDTYFTVTNVLEQNVFADKVKNYLDKNIVELQSLRETKAAINNTLPQILGVERFEISLSAVRNELDIKIVTKSDWTLVGEEQFTLESAWSYNPAQTVDASIEHLEVVMQDAADEFGLISVDSAPFRFSTFVNGQRAIKNILSLSSEEIIKEPANNFQILAWRYSSEKVDDIGHISVIYLLPKVVDGEYVWDTENEKMYTTTFNAE